jgi:hypothetical protein
MIVMICLQTGTWRSRARSSFSLKGLTNEKHTGGSYGQETRTPHPVRIRREVPRMKSVNFGRGTRASYGPGTPNEDVVVEIPVSGDLPTIQNNENARYYRFSEYTPFRANEDSIVVAIPAGALADISDWERVDEVRLYWVEERQEWVAFHFHEWVEDVWGTDIWAHGPYSVLGTQWVEKIKQAFGIDDPSLPEEKVIKSSPRSLTGRST